MRPVGQRLQRVGQKWPPPGPDSGTARWDLRAIDAALDFASDIRRPPRVGSARWFWINGRPNMRVHLKGVHRVEMRLATGETRLTITPGEAARGSTRSRHAGIHSPLPGGTRIIAKPKGRHDDDLDCRVQSVGRISGARPIKPPGVFDYIKLIEDEFGDLPLAALDDRRIRGEFKAGATGLPIHRERRTTLGQRSRVFCRSARIAD